MCRLHILPPFTRIPLRLDSSWMHHHKFGIITLLIFNNQQSNLIWYLIFILYPPISLLLLFLYPSSLSLFILLLLLLILKFDKTRRTKNDTRLPTTRITSIIKNQLYWNTSSSYLSFFSSSYSCREEN